MSTLAERCPTVWEVSSVGVDSELARLNLCGILASVALGPVLPDDGATLYGVRGAMERACKSPCARPCKGFALSARRVLRISA